VWDVRVIVRGSPLRASVVLARRGTETVVIDTGLPGQERALLAALADHGIDPDAVTTVLNTHSHVDHSHNNLLFRRARIVCSRRDREWTNEFHEALAAAAGTDVEHVLPFYPELARDGYDMKIVRKVLTIEKLLFDADRWGRAEQTEWLEETELPTGISTMPTPGHAPYHVSFLVEAAERPVLVTGDALLVRDEAKRGLQLVPPYDWNGYRASQERIHHVRGLVVPGHDDPFVNEPAAE
jgi:glyoxylase-like metal-dependent hydrolase (beta-lactamase superfamily II)